MMESLEDLDTAIERSLRSLFKGHPGTEDYIQEARIAVWRRLEDDPDTPLGFLLTIARSRAIDVSRGQRHFGAPERSPGSGSRKPAFASYEVVSEFMAVPTHDPIQDAEDRALVESVLDLLTDEERTIVTMSMAGWSQREMAAELGVSQAWITRRRLPNARAKVRPYLEELRAS